MKKEDGGDEDFVTKTNKSTRKKINKALSEENKDLSNTSTGTTRASSSANAEGISLRPRTMFTVKGRGRTEPDTSAAYRPQWSKDGDGFVSNTPVTKESGGENPSGERRRGKVLRYTKDELLALHVTTTSPPSFPPDTVVTLEEPLPPVSFTPFDYDEIYKQWALNRNRGRGRGRTTGGTNERGNPTGRTDGKWEDSKWEGKSRRGEDRSNGREESRWERGAAVETESTKADMWDDVVDGGDSTEMDLSGMAAAAESFRKEMDAMRDQVRQMELETAKGTDMDEFDQKLEKAAASGQFDDNVEEEVQWDTPTSGVQWDQPTTELESTSAQLPDDTLAFSSFQMTLDKPLSPSPESKPGSSMLLEQPTFSLPTLSTDAFDLGSLPLEIVEDEWFYLDPQNLQQGPFKTAEMREWFDAGYFKPNLPIRFGREGTFTPLANQFVQGQLPFATIPRPSPRISEQQRMMELHRQQQQQQQMLLLQQQQEQERIMQFNREEKIRLEMQRLEIARQQQNHLFQQQQMMHQQQQQQQHLLLQQQQMQQQQSSWQQSQRQGIMSALGILGGGGDQSSIGSDMSLGFPPDNRNNAQQYQRPISPPRESSFGKSQDPWVLGVNPLDRPREVSHDVSPYGGMQEKNTSPRQQTPVFADPWGKSKVVESPPKRVQFPPVELQPVEPSQPPASPPRETRREEARSRPQTAEREKLVPEKPSKKEKTTTAIKEKSKPARGNESEKNVWSSSSKTVASSAKSLKDIQEEEQRELRKTQGEKGESADLASMGAQLKMMLGVNESGAAAPQSANPSPSPAKPTASPWGKTAVVSQPQISSKSMREILAEEERLAVERAKRNDAAPTSSHWVNVVAGNTATPAVPKAARIPVPSSVLKSTTRTRTSVSGEITGVLRKPSTSTPSKAESDASFWNFGAAQSSKTGSSAVPSDFMAWCATQIKNINGSEDLTLVEYCATLEDPGEIREYMAAYLGSTPKVSAFASEFIQRKKKTGGSKKGTEDTESGNSTKKQNKRRTKGQKIDPSLLNYSVGS